MSIYVLKDYIKACKVLVQPSWEGLHKWNKEMCKY